MVGLRGWNERRAGRAVAGLYEEHGGAVFAFALHLCGSREDAEDVVQTAYLHAFRAISAGEELVNPRAWLMVAARRQVYNLWRGRRETALAEFPEASVEDPDGEALAELRRVRMVLFSLPEAQHQAFVLRHWSGLSNREIAHVLETSESAVETLLVRARAAILASGENVEDGCAGVRDRLAQSAALSQLDLAHIARCRGCGRAQARLARITAAAALVALVPRALVAQALAATVPGFKTGATAWLVAGKASAAKVVVAGVVSAGTIAVTAPVAAHALHHQFHHPAPTHAQQQVAAGDWHAAAHSTPGKALATQTATLANGENAQAHNRSHTSDGGDGSRSRDGTTGSPGGASQGGETTGSQDDNASGGGASSGDATSGSNSQGDTGSQGGSGSQGDGGDQGSSSDASGTDGNGQ